jgi:hypothetical protein
VKLCVNDGVGVALGMLGDGDADGAAQQQAETLTANRAHDEARDELLIACGLRVVRLRNEEVSRDRLEEILKDVPPLHVCGEGDRG